MNSLVCKLLIIPLLVLSMGFNIPSFSMIKQSSESGQVFIQLVNNTNSMAYCVIIGMEMRYFKDFYLREYSKSRFYIEPKGDYDWICQ